LLLVVLSACVVDLTPEGVESGVEGPESCGTVDADLELGSFPEGTQQPWVAFGDGEALCFRTGPSGNGSTWPEVRVRGGSGEGHVTARLVRDGELLYERRYSEVMSRPADDLCAHTTHFYLWLSDEVIRTFDGGPATLGALYEDGGGELLLQDSVELVPVVCNPEDTGGA